MQRSEGDAEYPLPAVCLASQIQLDAGENSGCRGRSDNDHDPQRILSRNLFDLSLGNDNLFKGDTEKWSLRLTAINIANNYSLYNFLSTFSGTHYVSPRGFDGGGWVPLLASATHRMRLVWSANLWVADQTAVAWMATD